MARIAAIGTAVPPFALPQEAAKAAAQPHFSRGPRNLARYLSVFDNSGVKCRHLCVPLEWFQTPHTLGEVNDSYIAWAERLSTQAVLKCLEHAAISAADVDHIVFVSSSGVATPSVEVRLINKLGFRRTVRRTPIFGLGCAGGAAGLSQSGLLATVPGTRNVLLIAVEINSFTFQLNDFSPGNLIACSLFSDGAAAVLISADEDGNSGPKILFSKSTLWPDTIQEMGWDFRDTGFRVIFSKRIPKLIVENMAATVEDLLVGHDIRFADITRHVFHPGGPKVLAAYQEAMPIRREDLSHSYEVLEQYGNMSSPSMLFVLQRFLEGDRPKPGTFGLCAAFGPGFSAELALIQW